MSRYALRIVMLIFCVSAICACSHLGVEPWERDVLAKPEMSLDSEGIDLGLDDHVYFSKEGSSGGRAYAGGGCGCN